MSWGGGRGEGCGGARQYLLEVDELRDGSHHLDGDLHHVLGRRHGSRGGSAPPAVPGYCRRRLPSRRARPPHRGLVPPPQPRAGPAPSPELTRVWQDPPPAAGQGLLLGKGPASRFPGNPIPWARAERRHRLRQGEKLWKVFVYSRQRTLCTNITGNFLSLQKKKKYKNNLYI